jgi:hypothetical protein
LLLHLSCGRCRCCCGSHVRSSLSLRLLRRWLRVAVVVAVVAVVVVVVVVAVVAAVDEKSKDNDVVSREVAMAVVVVDCLDASFDGDDPKRRGQVEEPLLPKNVRR